MKKLALYDVVALSVFALSACESKPKQPRVWKMELIGLQYDAYSERVSVHTSQLAQIIMQRGM